LGFRPSETRYFGPDEECLIHRLERNNWIKSEWWMWLRNTNKRLNTH
jgi:hypothetical protein